MIYCRILGYFIHHGPNDTARGVVVDKILSTGGDRVKLLQLGKTYYDHFTRLCVSLNIFSFETLTTHLQA